MVTNPMLKVAVIFRSKETCMKLVAANLLPLIAKPNRKIDVVELTSTGYGSGMITEGAYNQLKAEGPYDVAILLIQTGGGGRGPEFSDTVIPKLKGNGVTNVMVASVEMTSPRAVQYKKLQDRYGGDLPALLFYANLETSEFIAGDSYNKNMVSLQHNLLFCEQSLIVYEDK